MGHRPEILAPAGDEASLAAALAAGADAVYFGVAEGMNARARAANFPVATLPATCDRVHRAGARAYLTLNTLVFEDELPFVERLIRAAAEAGVDALIVQDPATALLARAVAPTLHVHASTQMTISSPEAARFAARLGVTRIVVPRELSVAEIRTFAAGTPIELEVFVHGALCVSWSGQCLTSEAWGGRSANRGQCAQSCRLPYGLVVDGVPRKADVRYLLSPLDLAAVRSVPGLVDAGVTSFKIEGRMKGPAYVAGTVAAYRHLAEDPTAEVDLGKLALTYSRGFSDGFLAGTDHQGLVEGRFPKHRGAWLGTVAEVAPSAVRVVREERGHGLPSTAEPAAGQGIGFDTGAPEAEEPGGPLFAVERTADGWWLRFGRPGPDLRRVSAGDRAWISGDPRLDREARALREPEGRIPVALRVEGAAGGPLRATLGAASGETSSVLSPADGRGLDEVLLREKLGALGGTPFRLDTVRNELPAGLHVPVSELKALRRRLVAELEAIVLASHRHAVDPRPGVPRVMEVARALEQGRRDGAMELVPLVRTDAQLDAVLALGVPYVELDWMERVGLGRAVERARAAGARVGIATVRVQKPGETGVDAHTERLRPDAVLVRHWGGLEHFAALPAERRPVVHGDFSLNVTNSVTARHLLALGCETLTASHDLDERQLHALLANVPAGRVTVVVHHHVPTFHTEHCVYARMLSQGRDFRTCGRPCEQHRLALRDPQGLDHPVVVDVGCRNTVFEARAQCTPSAVPDLVARGVRRFRVELVWEDAAETTAVVTAWRDLLAGTVSAADLLRRVSAHEQFGVTKGTMRTMEAR